MVKQIVEQSELLSAIFSVLASKKLIGTQYLPMVVFPSDEVYKYVFEL